MLNEKERALREYDRFDGVDNHMYVLDVDSLVVGFVEVSTSKENIDSCGELNRLYLINKYKGKGYGRLLFETAKIN